MVRAGLQGSNVHGPFLAFTPMFVGRFVRFMLLDLSMVDSRPGPPPSAPFCIAAPPGLLRAACGHWGGTGLPSLSLTALLLWSRTDRTVRVQKVFNGYLRVTNENFLDAYENPNSTEFAELANKVKEAVSPVPGLALCPCYLLPRL